MMKWFFKNNFIEILFENSNTQILPILFRWERCWVNRVLFLFILALVHLYNKRWLAFVAQQIWRWQNFLSFWTIFVLLHPQQAKKSKFWKKWKNNWRYYHFTQVRHKWQSYDVWFLRYEAWRTEFFVILDQFLPFYPHNNLENQNFEKLKKNT